MRRTPSLLRVTFPVGLRARSSRALAVASTAIALAACSAPAPDASSGPNDDPSASQEGRATSDPPAATNGGADDAPVPTALPGANASDRFCPSGFTYDAAHRLCTSATEAAGPFPPAMVDACTKSGGGTPCAGDRWAKALAVGLRGTGACPSGTTMNASIGYCTEGDDAYGPFSKTEVAACKAKGGGASCESMRWSVTFLGGAAGGGSGAHTNPLDVPYFNQYQDAKSSPGSSCGNTSAAMVLSYFGKKLTPDGVRSAFSGGGQCGGSYQPWQCADGLASIYKSEGLVGHAKNGATRADIKRMIDEGRPVIIHTNMTSAGHIVVIVGYDDAAKQWVVNDPAGHWCGDGYDSCGGRALTAKQIRYSYASFGTDVIGADGDVYISAADTKAFTL